MDTKESREDRSPGGSQPGRLDISSSSSSSSAAAHISRHTSALRDDESTRSTDRHALDAGNPATDRQTRSEAKETMFSQAIKDHQVLVKTIKEPPRFLLLLPPVASPATPSSLRAAYGDTVSEVLKEVVSHSPESNRAAVLEIALACPHLIGARDVARSSLYHQTQALVAGLYKLVCVLAAEGNINVEDADGVDVRVLLVAWSPDGPDEPLHCMPYGCVVDLVTLATCGRPWLYAFGVETDAGAAMLRIFTQSRNTTEEVTRERSRSLPQVEIEEQQQQLSAAAEEAAASSNGNDRDSANVNGNGNDATAAAAAEEDVTSSQPEDRQGKHYDVAVGGTFDHLHIGHKLLITMTIFTVDEHADTDKERSTTIGITGDALLVRKKHAHLLESWAERQRAVATFFNAILDFSLPATYGQRHVSIRDDPEPNGRSVDIHYPNGLIVKCTEIQDPYGPTITDPRISALVISAETRAGGQAVNERRQEKGWPTLDVLEVDVLDAEDEGVAAANDGFESKLSSTAIREKLAARKAGGKI